MTTADDRKLVDARSPAPAATTCPISGLAIRRLSEYQDVHLTPSHALSIFALGDRILVTRPRGHSEGNDVRQAMTIVREAVARQLPPGSRFVWLADYRNIEGTSREGRTELARTFSSWSEIGGLVLCGLKPMHRMAARLGARLGLVDFPVHLADTYEEAVGLAVRLAADLDRDQTTPRQAEHWRLDLGHFAAEAEILAGPTLHLTCRGRIDQGAITALFELQDRVLDDSGIDTGPFGILVGLEGVDRSTYRARQLYLKILPEWQREHPFRIHAFYGANTMMRAALNLTQPVLGMATGIAPSFAEGHRLVRRHLDSRSQLLASTTIATINPKARFSGADLQRFTDELLHFLGVVNWDANEDRERPTISASNPLRPVFEAVELLRTEMDDILRDRDRTEAERRALEQRLAERHKMEALGLLAGGVAHDLNNILSGIVSYPQLLLLDPDLSAEKREAISTIHSSGKRAAAIVEDLVTMARGAAVVKQPFDLSALVGEYLSSAELRQLEERFPGVELISELSRPGATVSGSTVHLGKVVMNLVTNAFEAAADGGARGRVTVRTRPGADQRVVLEVSDTGSGIADEDRQHLFEPFFTRKKMGRSGTGLGLTVVWNIVQDHDGAIDVRSSTTGTTFEVRLPASSAAPAAATARPDFHHLRGRGELVLVVDDEPTQRLIAAGILDQLGYRTETAANSREAIAIVRDHPVDLVLLDMIMDPGLDGHETYRALLEVRPGLPAILVSGFSETEAVRSAQQLGAGPLLSKPYSIEDLGRLVAEAFGRPTTGAGASPP